MNDYGTGGSVLGAATVLPATGAVALWFADKTNLTIIYGLLAVALISLLVNVAMIVRYMQNSRR